MLITVAPLASAVPATPDFSVLRPRYLSPGEGLRVSKDDLGGQVYGNFAFRLADAGVTLDTANPCAGGNMKTVSPDSFDSSGNLTISAAEVTGADSRVVVICPGPGAASNTPRLIVPIENVVGHPEISSVTVAGRGPYAVTVYGRHLPDASEARLDCGGSEHDHALQSNSAGVGGGGTMLRFLDTVYEPGDPRVCQLQVSTPTGLQSNLLDVHFGSLVRDNRWRFWEWAIIGLVVMVIAGLFRGVTRVGTRNPWWLRLVMDEGANRISLSRLQLYVWVTVVVMTTVLLSAIDGGLRAPLPTGLMAFSFVSLLTAAFGTYLNYDRWAEGPAQIRPRMWDLIMEYELIHWERVMYSFVTLLTLVYFFGSLLRSVDEGNEYDFDVPWWLVLVNVIFAILFLLGKIVRVPGPQLRGVDGGRLKGELTVTGSGLSPDAAFFIGPNELPVQLVNSSGTGIGKPRVLADDYRRRGYAKVLRFKMNPGSGYLWPPTEFLTIRNPDGQKAQCIFSWI